MKRWTLKRWTLVVSALFLTVMWSAAPALAAEAAGESGEANSPLYTPAQGLITGIVTIVVFVLLLVVLGKYAWGPILSGLKSREEKIRKDIADAEAMRVRAEAALSEYNEQLTTAEQKVRDMLERAAVDAEKISARLRTQAQSEAEDIRERAMKDIEGARAQALSEIYEQTADLATRVAEKILRRNLNAEDQRELVNQSLQELQTAGV